MSTDAEYIKKEEQIRKLQSIILLIEKEKDDIGYELHENYCQLIAASLLHIQMAKKNITGTEPGYLDEAVNILRDVLSEVRTMAKNISPISLKSLGFVNLLQDLCNLIKEQKEIDCMVSIDEGCIKTLPLHYQHTLYRVAQLQIINIIKCEDVSEVEISIQPFSDKVKMTIRDDGFYKNEHSHINSAGFKTLTDTIEAFDGNFNLKIQDKNQGMTLEVCI
jgi:signal transduction histidine kinase